MTIIRKIKKRQLQNLYWLSKAALNQPSPMSFLWHFTFEILGGDSKKGKAWERLSWRSEDRRLTCF